MCVPSRSSAIGSHATELSAAPTHTSAQRVSSPHPQAQHNVSPPRARHRVPLPIAQHRVPSQNSVQCCVPPGAQHSVSHSSKLSTQHSAPPELSAVVTSSVHAHPPAPPHRAAPQRSSRACSRAAMAGESETEGGGKVGGREGGKGGNPLKKIRCANCPGPPPGRERRTAALPAAPPVRPRTALFIYVGTARQ